MKNDDLKPCPLCGKEPTIFICGKISRAKKKPPEKYGVQCSSCYWFREIDMITGLFDTEEEAKNEWNRMVDDG